MNTYLVRFAHSAIKIVYSDLLDRVGPDKKLVHIAKKYIYIFEILVSSGFQIFFQKKNQFSALPLQPLADHCVSSIKKTVAKIAIFKGGKQE